VIDLVFAGLDVAGTPAAPLNDPAQLFGIGIGWRTTTHGSPRTPTSSGVTTSRSRWRRRLRAEFELRNAPGLHDDEHAAARR